MYSGVDSILLLIVSSLLGGSMNKSSRAYGC